MVSGDGWGLSFPDICFTVEEKTRKNLNQENWPDRGIKSGPTKWEAATLPLVHRVSYGHHISSKTYSSAMDGDCLWP